MLARGDKIVPYNPAVAGVRMFSVALLILSSCKLTGSEDDETPPTAAGTIIVDATLDPSKIGLDSFEIVEYRVDGRVLSLGVSYSGGCSEHDFDLFTHGAVILSIPPGADLYLVHEDNDDPCDSIVRETVTFDLGPLIESSGFSQILLWLYPHEGNEPLQPPALYGSTNR